MQQGGENKENMSENVVPCGQSSCKVLSASFVGEKNNYPLSDVTVVNYDIFREDFLQNLKRGERLSWSMNNVYVRDGEIVEEEPVNIVENIRDADTGTVFDSEKKKLCGDEIVEKKTKDNFMDSEEEKSGEKDAERKLEEAVNDDEEDVIECDATGNLISSGSHSSDDTTNETKKVVVDVKKKMTDAVTKSDSEVGTLKSNDEENSDEEDSDEEDSDEEDSDEEDSDEENSDVKEETSEESGIEDETKPLLSSKDEDEKPVTPIRRVKFNLNPVVRPMVRWNYAYRAARKGPWEEMARDGKRFRRRINFIERVLRPILAVRHRFRIWQERFARFTAE